jgi:hypothetical protein
VRPTKSKNPPYQLLFSLSYTLGSASDEKKEERERERGKRRDRETLRDSSHTKRL